MDISREEQKTEAIVRMKMLGISKITIELFKKENVVMATESPLGMPSELTDEDLIRIRDFETENGALVYAVISNYTNIGAMDSYLFVSKYQDEWETDREDIAHSEDGVLAYVYNHDEPAFSEFGTIGVRIRQRPYRSLVRIW